MKKIFILFAIVVLIASLLACKKDYCRCSYYAPNISTGLEEIIKTESYELKKDKPCSLYEENQSTDTLMPMKVVCEHVTE